MKPLIPPDMSFALTLLFFYDDSLALDNMRL